METAIRVCILGAVCALLSAALRKESPALALTIGLGGCAAAMLLLTEPLGEAVDTAKELADRGEISPAVVGAMWKTTAIALVTKLTSAFCKDAGNAAAGTVVDAAGCACALCAALPLLHTVLDMVEELL